MTLSERLNHIVDLIPPCECLADIGTDHGYVLIHCISKGICNKGIATDVKKGPIDIAIKNLKKYRVINKVDTRIGNGLLPLKEGEADVIVIAGMGGNLIANILKEGRHIANTAKYLILQPMQNPELLRKFLVNNNFKIVDEDIVKDDNKFYHIIKVINGKEEAYGKEVLYYVGKILLEKRHPLVKEYVDYKIKGLEEILKSVPKDSLRFNELAYLLNEFKEVREWLQR
ncbi:tRNA (adenine22-N1)-methyltransferase [Caloramator fervidus]|uniref:tRNA (Adenine22-N1)-methyltransferase n=1 Tax=Caloramator fervidus TaxID=29344 RepID=A0A1H5UI02_9CLOT|nr:class I SAM-dependent methyltransferase [Caloramator fervidus]SEF73897.1 tRNA (adenine22-N1)-methyltransferase [Caloramator fervidus]